MNIVTALLEKLTALLEYLDLVCNFLKGGGGICPKYPILDPPLNTYQHSNLWCSVSNRKRLVGSILRNGTERNDGLNHGMECFLKLKLAPCHC